MHNTFNWKYTSPTKSKFVCSFLDIYLTFTSYINWKSITKNISNAFNGNFSSFILACLFFWMKISFNPRLMSVPNCCYIYINRIHDIDGTKYKSLDRSCNLTSQPKTDWVRLNLSCKYTELTYLLKVFLLWLFY